MRAQYKEIHLIFAGERQVPPTSVSSLIEHVVNLVAKIAEVEFDIERMMKAVVKKKGGGRA
jgi:hypothetical protein